jgi:hypothetical protein
MNEKFWGKAAQRELDTAISLDRLAMLVKEITAAVDANDFTHALDVERQLKAVGYSIVVSQGKLLLENDTYPKAMPEKAEKSLSL